jgi:3-phosphoglycerate kinase
MEPAARRFRDTALRSRYRGGGEKDRRTHPAGKLLSVAGRGDTVSPLAAGGVTDELSYVSTAGGAFLERLEKATRSR